MGFIFICFLTHPKQPCVIKMHDIVDKPDSVYMVLEYMKGGDLLSRIISKGFLPEKTAKLLFLQMCHAVKYLHEQGKLKCCVNTQRTFTKQYSSNRRCPKWVYRISCGCEVALRFVYMYIHRGKIKDPLRFSFPSFCA